MSIGKTALFRAGILAVVCSTGSVAQEPVKAPGDEMFTQRCSVCHALTTATTQRHSDAEWRAIIERMVMNGSQATDEEREIIADYLAKNYGPDTTASVSPAPAPVKVPH